MIKLDYFDFRISHFMQSERCATILHKAEKICLRRGVRFTPLRSLVLGLIAKQSGAISAYQLLDILQTQSANAKPPTVYRALEFLLIQGFIHKIESTNSYILCHHISTADHNCALFICDSCRRVVEYIVPEIERALMSMAQRDHFYTEHSIIETHGRCQRCHDIATITDGL